jgi:hypothetical protein
MSRLVLFCCRFELKFLKVRILTMMGFVESVVESTCQLSFLQRAMNAVVCEIVRVYLYVIAVIICVWIINTVM